MNFASKSGSFDKLKSDCLLVAIFQDGRLSPSAQSADELSGGAISAALKSGDMKGNKGDTLLLHNPAGLASSRLLLVGCGKADELDEAGYRSAVKAAIEAIKKTSAKSVLFALTELSVGERDLHWRVRQAAELVGDALYRFEQMKGKGSEGNDKAALRTVNFLSGGRGQSASINRACAEASAIISGMDLAKDLANLPGNVCTPSYLASQARALGRKYSTIKTSILDEKQMEQLGMGALLSVSRGSRQPARLIVMQYSGAKDKKAKPIALVGKGLTFDAGGISLKPAAGMDEMKYDMGGAAGVFGAIKAIAELQLPINVVAVVPSSENLPDGDANKPGDIVTSMSGQTIEILNTDAEGRLILCDALTYTERFKPAEVIDLATLTGACVIALGKHASGLFSQDDTLAEGLLAAGQQSGDRAWRMPLWDDYQEQLKSPFADMANVGGREGGAITAACFLARYTKKFTWAHLDIAGTAWNSGANKGATGRPVPLLTQYLIGKAGQ